jgi:hypothetical protein
MKRTKPVEVEVTLDEFKEATSKGLSIPPGAYFRGMVRKNDLKRNGYASGATTRTSVLYQVSGRLSRAASVIERAQCTLKQTETVKSVLFR